MARHTRGTRIARLAAAIAIARAIAGCGGSGGNQTTDGGVPIDAPIVVPHLLVLTVQVDGKGTVTSSPAGITCGGACMTGFGVGQQVTLTATPGNGATFTGWGAPCTGTAPCTLTIRADTTVTATFAGGCEDECVAGTHQCMGRNADQACGNFDDDPCLELGPPAQCTGGEECIATRCGDYHLLSVAPLPLDNQLGTITSSPPLVQCGDDANACNFELQDGEQITLTATSDDVATFDGWAEVPLSNQPNVAHCIGSTAPCTFTMTAVTSLLAVYCTSECPAGGVRCSGNTDVIETCGQLDDDRCTEFGPPATCPAGQLCTPAGCAAGGIVTATAAGDGQVAIDGVTCAQAPCTQGVVTGTTAQITAIPAPDAVFTGWSGACSGTGPCTAGAGATVTATFGDRCTETILDTLGGSFGVDPVALNATDVYWGDRSGLTLRRVSRAGGAPTTIATATDPFMIVTDATYAYWLDFDSNLGQSAIRRFGNGSGDVLVPAVRQHGLGPLALSATHIYYPDGDKLYRVPKSGGAPELIASGMPVTDFAGVRLATDATDVYWIEFFGQVMKVPLGGGTPVEVSPRLPFSDTPLTQTYGIALDADHVYFSRMDFPKIVRVNKNGGPLETVVRHVGAFNMQIDGDTLMWAGFGPPSATRIGSGVTVPLTKKASGDIAFDGSDVFYTGVNADISSSFIYRLPRTSTCPP